MNTVYLEFTKFLILNDNGETKREQIGYVLYNDEAEIFHWYSASFPAMCQRINKKTVFSYLMKHHDLFYYAAESDGLYLNGVWVDSPREQLQRVQLLPRSRMPKKRLMKQLPLKSIIHDIYQ